MENFRSRMERLEEDLRFYMRELERENDPFQKWLIRQRIAATQRAVLALMIEEREEVQRQNANMERALEILRKREEDKNIWVFWENDFVLSIKNFLNISCYFSELSYRGQTGVLRDLF